MIGFIGGAALIALTALAILLRPLIWRRTIARPNRRRANAAVYRDQLARLEQDLAEGSLQRDEYTRSRQELERRALDDVLEDAPDSPRRTPRGTLVGLSLVIPAAAVGLYLLIGNVDVLSPHGAEMAVGNAEIEQMVARLAAKLEQDPSDKKGWAMLARSYKAMGRLAESERAYEKAGDFIDGDAQELANYADVAASNAGGHFVGKPVQLIEKALRVDPANPMALWLAGSAAQDSGDMTGAVRIWERLLALLPPDSDDARELKAMIDRTRGSNR